MDELESIDLLAMWQQGDQQAAQALFDRYANRLIALARVRLSEKMKRRVGPEDVVQSVYRSFFQRAQEGKFSLEKSGDLWRLLAAITVTKVRGKVEFHSAKKRSIAAEGSIGPETSFKPMVDAPSPEPSPQEAIILLEELELLLSDLQPQQRSIVELALQNHSIEEISSQAGRSQRTVRRTLQNLRLDLEQRLRSKGQ